jgi:hypothetical protein
MSAYDLIAHLNLVYPHQCITSLQTLEDAHRYAGKRELIDTLISAMTHEQDT